MATILQTQRLTLRELQISDLDYIAELLADREVMRFWDRIYSRAESLEWIERQQARYARDGFAYWLALETATAKPVGQAGVLLQRINGRDEAGLAYIIDKAHWRCGFATEAAASSLQFIRSSLGRRRAISLIRPENIPSLGVARKLDMHEEARLPYWGFEHIVFVKEL